MEKRRKAKSPESCVRTGRLLVPPSPDYDLAGDPIWLDGEVVRLFGGVKLWDIEMNRKTAKEVGESLIAAAEWEEEGTWEYK